MVQETRPCTLYAVGKATMLGSDYKPTMAGSDYHANELTQHHLALIRSRDVEAQPPSDALLPAFHDNPGQDDNSFYQIVRRRMIGASEIDSFLKATPREVPPLVRRAPRRTLPNAPQGRPKWRKESGEWLMRKKLTEEVPEWRRSRSHNDAAPGSSRSHRLRRESSVENDESLATRVRSENGLQTGTGTVVSMSQEEALENDRDFRRSTARADASGSALSSLMELSALSSHSALSALAALQSLSRRYSCAAPLSRDGQLIGLTTFYHQMRVKFPNAGKDDSRPSHSERAPLAADGSARRADASPMDASPMARASSSARARNFINYDYLPVDHPASQPSGAQRSAPILELHRQKPSSFTEPHTRVAFHR